MDDPLGHAPEPDAHRQRFIAYALICYMEFVRRMRAYDVNLNYTMGPRCRVTNAMLSANLRPEIMDLFNSLDEIDTLFESVDVKEFDEVVARAIAPVMHLLLEDAPRADGIASPIEVLLRRNLE